MPMQAGSFAILFANMSRHQTAQLGICLCPGAAWIQAQQGSIIGARAFSGAAGAQRCPQFSGLGCSQTKKVHLWSLLAACQHTYYRVRRAFQKNCVPDNMRVGMKGSAPQVIAEDRIIGPVVQIVFLGETVAEQRRSAQDIEIFRRHTLANDISNGRARLEVHSDREGIGGNGDRRRLVARHFIHLAVYGVIFCGHLRRVVLRDQSAESFTDEDTGSGRSMSALTTLKIAVLAPMARASVRIAVMRSRATCGVAAPRSEDRETNSAWPASTH